MRIAFLYLMLHESKQFERFRRIFHHSTYRVLLGHKQWKILSSLFVEEVCIAYNYTWKLGWVLTSALVGWQIYIVTAAKMCLYNGKQNRFKQRVWIQGSRPEEEEIFQFTMVQVWALHRHLVISRSNNGICLLHWEHFYLKTPRELKHEAVWRVVFKLLSQWTFEWLLYSVLTWGKPLASCCLARHYAYVVFAFCWEPERLLTNLILSVCL